MPRITAVRGVELEMSYESRFFLHNTDACGRVMAVLALASLSHFLPTTPVNEMSGSASSSDDDDSVAPPAAVSASSKYGAKCKCNEVPARTEADLAALLCTPYVLHYHRAAFSQDSSVAWCSLGTLLESVFHGVHVPVTHGTLRQFDDETANEPAHHACAGNPLDDGDSPPLVHVQHEYAYAEGINDPETLEWITDQEFHSLDRMSPEDPTVISLTGLCPSFHHAAIACWPCQDQIPYNEYHDLHGCELPAAAEHRWEFMENLAQAWRRQHAEEPRAADQSFSSLPSPLMLDAPGLGSVDEAADEVPGARSKSIPRAVVRITTIDQDSEDSEDRCHVHRNFLVSHIAVPCL